MSFQHKHHLDLWAENILLIFRTPTRAMCRGRCGGGWYCSSLAHRCWWRWWLLSSSSSLRSTLFTSVYLIASLPRCPGSAVKSAGAIDTLSKTRHGFTEFMGFVFRVRTKSCGQLTHRTEPHSVWTDVDTCIGSGAGGHWTQCLLKLCWKMNTSAVDYIVECAYV